MEAGTPSPGDPGLNPKKGGFVSDNLQWKIGQITITRVEERIMLLPADFLLPLASADGLEAHAGWMKPWAIDDEDQLTISIHSLCIEEGGRKIVVDTCFGAGPLPEGTDTLTNDGSFLTELADAGFGRDLVDLVICTHLHVDHVGWNTMVEDGRRVPTFPRARYMFSRTEFDHWNSASEEARMAAGVVMFDNAITPLVDFDVVDLVDTDHHLSETIEFVPTPGHSPGHFSVRITSGGETALITGDCAHSPIEFAEPDWYAMNDVDRQASCSTRRRLVDELADSPVLIIGTHFPPPTAGHLVSTDNGVWFRPFA
jgi:glyoxylase-like metal-dependent hydrolase (beta-lactamase superfamily II)